MTKTRIGAAALVLFITAAGIVTTARSRNDLPETVMITYRPKAGADAELAKVVAQHWQTARQQNLVLPEPHLTLEMKDDGNKLCIVDIFTWRDEEIPDNAPAAIQSIWAEMSRLTESRGGKPGIDIARVTIR